MFSLASKRVLVHPRPFILRYLLSFIPALLFSVTITIPVWRGFSYPYIQDVLDRRETGILLDALMYSGDTGSNLLLPVIMVLLALAVWIPMQMAAAWLEGGTLSSYTAEKPVTWKEFLTKCNRWFSFMLLIRGLSGIITLGLSFTIVLTGILLHSLWKPLLWLDLSCGMLLIVCLHLWFEIVRTVAVTGNQRQLGYALHTSITLIRQRALPGFMLISAVSMLCLLLFQRWVTSILPVSWWLFSLIVLQGLELARHSLRLIRQAGEIGFAQDYNPGGFPSVQE